MTKCFKLACVENNLENAKHIYFIEPKVINSFNDVARNVCKKGLINIVKWFFQTVDEYNVKQHNYNLFNIICGHGQLEVIQLFFCYELYQLYNFQLENLL